jgi:hypothetical protein
MQLKGICSYYLASTFYENRFKMLNMLTVTFELTHGFFLDKNGVF